MASIKICQICNNNICGAGKFCYYCGNEIKLIGVPTPVVPKPLSVKQVSGIAQKIAFELPIDETVGIMIASNAGRPAGWLGKKDGSGINPSTIDKLINADNIYTEINSYDTQEEDVLASWFRAEKLKWEAREKDLTATNPGRSIIPFNVNKLYRETLGNNAKGSGKRPWGMKNPWGTLGEKDGLKTLQGWDFTRSYFNNKRKEMDLTQLDKYDFVYSLLNKPMFNNTYTAIRDVNFFFVYGPNIGFPKEHQPSTSTSTGERTKIKHYDYGRDYLYFEGSVKKALRAGLIGMIEKNIDHALIAGVSTGIYSGRGTPTSIRLNKNFTKLVNEILDEQYKISGREIRSYFKSVLYPKK